MLSLLIGSLPSEGSQALSSLAMPFFLFNDPADDLMHYRGHPLQVQAVPFKSDPLSVLKVPISEEVTSVFSFTEHGLLPAALVADVLSIPTIPVATVLKTRNKFLMRCALKGKISQPEFGFVGDCDAKHIPYPVIIKPLDSSGSREVEYVATSTAFEKRLSQRKPCMWEQYIDGPEFSVETVTWEGNHQVLGITEKVTTGAPSFVEVGHLVPARLSPIDMRKIIDTVCRCLDILGVNTGASHTEVKYANSQAIIIETHTRPGGDRIPLLTKLVTGFDQYKLAIMSILGMAPLEADTKIFNSAGVRYFRWPQGVISDIEGIDECRRMPGVVELELNIAEGDQMPQWKHSHDRPGFVVVGGSSIEEIEARFTVIEKTIQIRYK